MHTIFCIISLLSRNLSHLAVERFSHHISGLWDQMMLSVACRLVDVLWDDIWQSIVKMLARYGVCSIEDHISQLLSATHNNISLNNSYEVHQSTQSDVLYMDIGTHGRQGRLRVPVDRSQVVLTEGPAVAAPITSCCRDQGSCGNSTTILPAHIHLAWNAIHLSSQQFNDVINTLRTPKFSSEPCDLTCTCNDSPAASNCQCTVCRCSGWRGDVLMMMSIAVSITTKLMNPYINTDPWDMLRALTRIPHNTHCIHNIRKVADNVVDTKIGLAVYLTASCINHSCQPNASVKYAILEREKYERESQAGNSNPYSSVEAMSYAVDVVLTRNVSPEEEVTISYGPLPSTPFEQRQNLLYDVYQFRCQCNLCLLQSSKVPGSDACSAKRSPVEECVHLMDDKDWTDKMQNITVSLRNIQENVAGCLEQSGSVTHRVKNELNNCRSQALEIYNALEKLPLKLSKKNEAERDMLMCTALDILGHIDGTLGHYMSAINFIEKAITIMRKGSDGIALPDDDIIISRERVKIVQMLYMSEKWKQCYNLSVQLIESMRPYVDTKSDPDYVELKSILSSMRNMIK